MMDDSVLKCKSIRGRLIGKSDDHLYYWISCSKCHCERWVSAITLHRNPRPLCPKCIHPLLNQNRLEEDVIKNPQIGDIVSSRILGRKDKSGYYIWCSCEICGKTRWVRSSNKPTHHCLGCSSILKSKSIIYINGERIGVQSRSDGYLSTIIRSNSPYYAMAKVRGLILVHRLVMAMYLKRCLEDYEVVHHINNNRADNRIENLEVVTRRGHLVYTRMQQEIDRLRIEVNELRLKQRLNEWRIKELEQVGEKSQVNYKEAVI